MNGEETPSSASLTGGFCRDSMTLPSSEGEVLHDLIKGLP